MPRTYVKKKPPPPYTQEELKVAVFDVLNKNKTYREAQETYGVPVSVIYHRINGRKTSINRLGAGRSPDLSQDVEECLVKCLIARAQMGFPCDKQELKDLVQKFIQSNKMKTRFKDGRPGEDWYLSFMQRNPSIRLKKPEHLQKSRKKARDPFVVYEFYENVMTAYSSSHVDENSARLIFNADETGFANDPSRLRAIGEKGKALQRVSDGSGRESTTVLACVSASGDIIPPLIVHKGAAVQPRWISDKAYPGTMYATSSNGWLEEPVFFNWFEKMFLSAVKKVREEDEHAGKTAILFYDGHASHISIRIIELAISNNIQIIKFPSHLTDRLQPLDKCVFGPLKTAWERVLVEHGRTKMGNSPARLTKNEFTELLGMVWTKIKRSNIVSGFTSTGLFPLDKTKIPEDMFDPQDLARYHQRCTRAEMITASSQTTLESVEGPSVPDLKDVMADDGFFRGQIVPSADNDDEVAVDLSFRRSYEEKPSPSDTSGTVSDMVAIFSRSISKSTSTTRSPTKKEGTGTRLKHQTYGEVLTSEDVLERLKEAEEKKAKKRKKGVDKGKSGNREEPKKTKKSSTKEADTESEEELFNSEEEEDMDLQNLETEQLELEEVTYMDPVGYNILPNVFVLVEILGGKRCKTTYRYLCKVDEVSNELEVMGLKSIDHRKSKFLLIENDQFSVAWDQVKAILPTPEIQKDGRKNIFKFSGMVNVKEM